MKKRSYNTPSRYNLRKKHTNTEYKEPDDDDENISFENPEAEVDNTSTSTTVEDEISSTSDDDNDYEEEEDEEESVLEKCKTFVEKLDPESRQKWILVNKELDRTEPNIQKILQEKISITDMTKIIQLLEVYQNSNLNPDESTIYLRNKINKMIENSRKEYEQLSQFSEDVKEKMEVMDKELSPVSTHNLYKYKILTLQTSQSNKEAIYKRFLEMVDVANESDTDEYFKIKRWLDCALALPHDTIKTISDDSNTHLILKARRMLDKELYGMDNVKEQILLYLNNRLHNPSSRMSLGLIGCPGVGKCFAKNTPIMMSNGTIKYVQNVQIGDLLMGDDGCSERRVVSLARGMEKMYKVVQAAGISYTVNESHILSLYSKEKKQIQDLPLTEYLKLPDETKEDLFGIKVGVEHFFVRRPLANMHNNNTSLHSATVNSLLLPYDAYLVGYFNGRGLDGSIRNSHLPNSNVAMRIAELVDMEKVSKEEDKIFRIKKWRHKADEVYFQKNRIPHEYLTSSFEDRKYLLLGLMDACVSFIDNEFKIATYDKGFHDDCLFLARSLGLQASAKLFENVRLKNRIVTYDLRVITIQITHFAKYFEDDFNASMVNANLEPNLYPIQICEEEVGDYYGFTLASDSNNRFLLGDFTVAHNTKIARSLAKILDYPFEQLSFGGITGPEFIRGHDYTYIGSKPGMIVEALKRMKYKNGIMFLDEIDKASENKDISSTLLHVTDPIQNHEFRDRYLSELTIDLSQLWFIYSMNSYPTDLALRDRIHMIEVQGYSTKDKIEISKNYLFPTSLANIGRKKKDVLLTDEVLYYLINRVCSPSDKGVRTIEKAIANICSKIHFLITNSDNLHKLGNISFTKPSCTSHFNNLKYPITLTKELVDAFTACNEQDYILRTMYT